MHKTTVKSIIKLSIIAMLISSCTTPTNGDFKYYLEQFADLKIMRYKIPDFDSLSLEQKKMVYFLSEAARCGRDIIFDQNCKYNLMVRRSLENIYKTYKGDRENEDFKNFTIYLKRVWFANGIHHHYSQDKFVPEFSSEYLKKLIEKSDKKGFPIIDGEDFETFYTRLEKVIFDKDFMAKRVSLDPDKDLVKSSAVNFYDNVSQKEAEEFYEKQKDKNDPTPISYGLNTKLIKKDDTLIELPYKSGGLYSKAINEIIYWLEKATEVAEPGLQKEGLEKLIAYYKSGDLELWDEYNVLWVKEVSSTIDYINGFVEVYGDPMGLKATWESVVEIEDKESTKRTKIVSQNAQWFEDNSPIEDRFKKDSVKGVIGRVINVAQLGGDCYPATPIGINLPNADWIRKEHGSKSVTIENITNAYNKVSLESGFLEEFAESEEEIQLIKKHGSLSGNLHTDLHEILGHGSGQLLPGTASDALKNYQSTLEEARADLFALYYIMDEKLIELGIIPSLDVAKAEYISYIRNGLITQLTRIEPGKDIEESHMRNRQLIAEWCYQKGADNNVIEYVKRDGKTYVKINDFEKLRVLFGELLAEVQRIKSEGDFEAGKALVEDYGVEVDDTLHEEILARFKKLNIAPYGGFINPEFEVVKSNGEITNIIVKYPDDYAEQMLEYSKKYSYLPTYNF